MKRKRRNTNSTFQIASLSLTVAGFVWIGGFELSTIKHDINDIKEEIKEIKIRLDRLEADFHNMDLRVSNHDTRLGTLEQHHP